MNTPLPFLCLFAWLCLPEFGGARLAAAPRESPPTLRSTTVVWERETHGYNIFKVPSLVTDRTGKVLLAIAEGRVDSRADDAEIRLVQRRSLDGGKSWSAMSVVHQAGRHTAGNPAPVLDRETGTIWLFFCIDNREVWLTSTTDAGETWAPPRDLSRELKRPEQTRFFATGPGHGIQLEQGPKRGRLLVTGYASQLAVPPHTAGSKSFAIFSDDHGQSWHMGRVTQESEPGGPDGNECMTVELSDGRLYLTIRNNLKPGGRAYALSADAGETWSTVQIEPALPEPVCEASIVRQRLATGAMIHLYAAPSASARGRMDKSARRDLSLWVSTDDCGHWRQRELLWAGPSAYSDLTVLGDGTLCAIFEAGKDRYDDQIVLKAYRFNEQ